MFAGFDYGTSNCAIGVIEQQDVSILGLDNGSRFMPSTVYALEREMITEAVLKGIDDKTLRSQFQQQRMAPLQEAQRCRVHHGFEPDEITTFVGSEAIEAYLETPEEGYFIKSPKSFLGANGLSQAQIAFFEDLVSLMMQRIKQSAEQKLGYEISQTVIGKPVNFQGSKEHVSNQQALEILRNAASRAGFKDVEFLYEPLAAGIDFETTLNEQRTVLVVDVGGGTTDCSVVLMGPDKTALTDRENDFLGHSGLRVGGNDLDINLSMKRLMPLFGLGSSLKSDRPLPSKLLWDAVAINDVGAQKHFKSQDCVRELEQFLLESREPQLIKRLQILQRDQKSYQLVRSSELCKIALSDQQEHRVTLDYIEEALDTLINQQQFAEAIERPLEQITDLMSEALNQAGTQPDIIYVTGGTAKSPVIHQSIQQLFPDTPVIIGDHFGSVTAGLTKWAARLFR